MKGLLIAMRKKYVKPVMENENFVANEYIAACWEVSCSHCQEYGTVIIGGRYSADANGFQDCVSAQSSSLIHLSVNGHHVVGGTNEKNDPNGYYHGSGDRNHHKLNYSLNGYGTTANAS